MKQKINNRLSILMICFVFSLPAIANNNMAISASDTLTGSNSAVSVLTSQESFNDLDSYFANQPAKSTSLQLDLQQLNQFKAKAIQAYQAKTGNQVESFTVTKLTLKQVGKNNFVEIEGNIALQADGINGLKTVKANSFWATDSNFSFEELLEDALNESFYAL